MRHKNFVVGMVVGAMLAGAGFIVGTVDAAPRRPGPSPTPPRGTEKRIPGPKKKETRDPIPVVYECPADREMRLRNVDELRGLPSGWERVTLKGRPLYFAQSNIGAQGDLVCSYDFGDKTHALAVRRAIEGTDCSFSDGGRKLTCYK